MYSIKSDVLALFELLKKQRVSLLTGAGTSIASQVLDFETMQEKTLELTEGLTFLTVFTNRFAQKNPEIFYPVYRKLFLVPERMPNVFHETVAWMDQQQIFEKIVTMNLDNLLEKAGCSDTLSMWGGIEDNFCVSCKKKFSSDYIRNHPIPYCDNCQGLVLPIFVSRNMVALKRGIDWANQKNKGLVLASGSKLEHGFDFSQGLIIVNQGETKYDKQADLIIREDLNEVFAELKSLFQKEYQLD